MLLILLIIIIIIIIIIIWKDKTYIHSYCLRVLYLIADLNLLKYSRS